MSSRKDFGQQFPSPPRQKDFGQQFPSPPSENEKFHTPPEHIFPVFQPENFPVNNQPENEPVPNQDPNPFGLTEEQLRQEEADMQVLLEMEALEREEEADRLERQAREDEERRQRWESGFFTPSESSEDGYPDSDDSFY
jgi:hypothetical protein